MGRFILICAVAMTLAACGTAAGETFIVDQGGGGDYPEIKPALFVATTGDTVLVMPGTYTGGDNTGLDFDGEGITLKAHGGARSTVIDCEDSSQAFSLSDGEMADTVIEGFTVTNGNHDFGGAMYCSGSHPTFVDCTFSSCYSRFGGGAVYLTMSSPTFTDCAFTGNSSPGQHGGAMLCANDSEPVLTRSVFSGGSANIGSAISCLSSSSANVIDCTFSGNTQGCAVYCQDCSPVFTGCTFTGNSAGYAGAVYVYASAAEFTDCVFIGNVATAGHDGGAFYCDTGAPQLLNCTFSDNNTEDVGGTIYCLAGSPSLTNCVVAFDVSGPGVYCHTGYVSNPQLVCCDIYGNTGGNWVGCIADQSAINDNMEVDPEFCDRPLDDFRIFDTSPCTAANNIPCGLVGALDIGCGSPVTPASWGAIKALYR